MKKKTTVTEKYNEEGNLIEKVTIIEEEDEITDINIQRPSTNPQWVPGTTPLQPWTYPTWVSTGSIGGTTITSGYIRGVIENADSIIPQSTTYTNILDGGYITLDGDLNNTNRGDHTHNGEQQQE